jgi:hypothetical protein
MNALMPHAYIIELLTDFFSFNTLKKIHEKRSRPRQGTPEYFAWTLQRLIDNPPPPHQPYVAPCGGVGNHSDPTWWEERLEDRIYEDDDESFGARLNRSLRAKKSEREDAEREKEAIRLRERLEKGYRVHGWDKLERPVSIIEARYTANHRPQF